MYLYLHVHACTSGSMRVPWSTCGSCSQLLRSQDVGCEAGLSCSATFLSSSWLAGLLLLAASPVPTSHPATGLLGLEIQTALSGFSEKARN